MIVLELFNILLFIAVQKVKGREKKGVFKSAGEILKTAVSCMFKE